MITDNSIQSTPFKYQKVIWQLPLLCIIVLWAIYWCEYYFNLNFNDFGIYPRTLKGLRGIILSPLIHGSAVHLTNNSIPLFSLMMALLYFYKPIANKVLILGILISGSLTWLMARPAYHIGISGLIYVLASFIFFSGLIRKNFRLVAISLIVAFWYGSMIWYVLPIDPQMSWEGHLSGFITGLLLAYYYKTIGLTKEKYTFTRSEFDNYFDNNGNFTGIYDEENDCYYLPPLDEDLKDE